MYYIDSKQGRKRFSFINKLIYRIKGFVILKKRIYYKIFHEYVDGYLSGGR